MKKSLDFLYKIQKELSIFGGIGSLLDWDQKTYMPTQGAIERSDQISLISRLSHERFISEELWNHVRKLTDPDVLNKLEEKDQIVVKRLEKDIEKARKIPPDFVEELSKTTSLAYVAWQGARENNNFDRFSPHLEKIVELRKRYCEYIGLPGHPYNSLLDDFEEGMTVEKLKQAFSYLKPRLVEILGKIKDSECFNKQRDVKMNFDAENQKQLCFLLIKKMLIPSDKARLDVSTHPFTTSIGNDDVRFTTNYGRKQPLFAFFSTLHEAGHALYSLGLPKDEYKYTVISDAPSFGLHESQSRFWENMIGRSRNFWKYFYPVLQKTFTRQLRSIDLETWYFYVNQVNPSFIRIEADELTYGLHIILRFEIELALIDNNIKVSDLPGVWNEKMKELLGIVPKTDTEGVLQDMHWSVGDIGYFPTYAIGTIYATQLFHQLSQENPEVYNEIGQANFTNILSWLREHVHKHGRVMTAEDIVKNVCGEGLNSRIFISFLKDKYYPLYGV
ncbi:MAG: carboxypeptidase M32 [Thermoplasmatales archaeon]|nr:MAG: carboxypeptidase M32 [Thermoplasmatales archaeon]